MVAKPRLPLALFSRSSRALLALFLAAQMEAESEMRSVSQAESGGGTWCLSQNNSKNLGFVSAWKKNKKKYKMQRALSRRKELAEAAGVASALLRQSKSVHSTTQRQFFEHGGLTLPSSKSLWDILKREHIEGHSTQHVKDIWQEYHLDPAKHRVSTVLSAAKYRTFCETAALTPMFVLPVFRGPNSFETFALQCQPPLILFTSLEEFKRHGSSATPHLVVSHYRELEHSHNVVLVRGDILQPHALDAIQASSLMHNAHEYFTDFGAKREFVHLFNKRPEQFDFKKMLDSMGHATDRLEI